MSSCYLLLTFLTLIVHNPQHFIFLFQLRSPHLCAFSTHNVLSLGLTCVLREILTRVPQKIFSERSTEWMVSGKIERVGCAFFFFSSLWQDCDTSFSRTACVLVPERKKPKFCEEKKEKGMLYFNLCASACTLGRVLKLWLSRAQVTFAAFGIVVASEMQRELRT